MSPTRNHRVGVIVAPRYFDTTSLELTDLVPDLEVLRTQIRVEPDLELALDQIIDTAPLIQQVGFFDEACGYAYLATEADVTFRPVSFQLRQSPTEWWGSECDARCVRPRVGPVIGQCRASC